MCCERLEHRVLPSSMMPLTGLGFESQATCLLDVVSCEFWRRKPWGSQFRVGTAQLLFALSRQTVEGPVRAGIVEHGALYLSVLSLSLILSSWFVAMLRRRATAQRPGLNCT